MTTIDDLNYASDPRVRDAGKNGVPTISVFGCGVCGEAWGNTDPDAKTCDCDEFVRAHFDVELPWKWSVCTTCRGEGRHVNPSIDCGGISAQDFHDDPDFADEYMRGTYDQDCTRCAGKRVVPAVDVDAMSSELMALWEAQVNDDAAYDAERLAEIRAGC